MNPHVDSALRLVLRKASDLIILAKEGPIINANALDVGEFGLEGPAKTAAIQSNVGAWYVERCDQSSLSQATILDPAIERGRVVEGEGIQSVDIGRSFKVNLATDFRELKGRTNEAWVT